MVFNIVHVARYSPFQVLSCFQPIEGGEAPVFHFPCPGQGTDYGIDCIYQAASQGYTEPASLVLMFFFIGVFIILTGDGHILPDEGKVFLGSQSRSFQYHILPGVRDTH